MKATLFICSAILATVVLFSSCKKDSDTSNNSSSCNGTTVADNTWAVVLNGQTTTVTMEEATIGGSSDYISYIFQGASGSTDMITFSFRGTEPPASGTYSLIGTDATKLTSNNQAASIGLGSGTPTMGGGLFANAESGNVTVTNNAGVITIAAKGLKYKTATSQELCVSVSLTK